MRRFSLIFLMIFMAAFAVAQTTPSAPATTPTTPTDGTVVTPSSPTGPTTPVINLGTTSPSPVGASNATPGNQAGATNSTIQPTAAPGVAPQSVYTTPMVQNMPNWTTVAPAAGTTDQTITARDLLIGGSDSAWSISGGGVSVAAAARQYRAQRANHKPRMFTNADIARLSDRSAVSVVGNTPPPVTNEQTMPASDVETEGGPTTPTAPQQQMQAPEQTVPAGQPKSPFRKPSPQVQPQPR
jgi:hypothetical protein